MLPSSLISFPCLYHLSPYLLCFNRLVSLFLKQPQTQCHDWTFALAVPSVWNTSPIDICLMIHSDLRSNVSSSRVPLDTPLSKVAPQHPISFILLIAPVTNESEHVYFLSPL